MKTDLLLAAHQAIEELPDDIRALWFDDDFQINLPAKSIKNLIFIGSESGVLGAHLIADSLTAQISKPWQIVSDFRLPASASPDSLVVVLADRLTHDRCLSIEKKAIAQGSKVVFASTDPLFSSRSTPNSSRICLPTHTSVARYQIGVLAAFILRQFVASGALQFQEKELHAIIKAMGEVIDSCADDVPSKANPAATVAAALGRTPVIVFAAEHLSTAAAIFSEQLITESGQLAFNGKISSSTQLTNPETPAAKFLPKLTALLILSPDYEPESKLALDSLANRLEKLNVKVVEYVVGEGTLTSQSFETLQFANFVSVFLARKNKINFS